MITIHCLLVKQPRMDHVEMMVEQLTVLLRLVIVLELVLELELVVVVVVVA